MRWHVVWEILDDPGHRPSGCGALGSVRIKQANRTSTRVCSASSRPKAGRQQLDRAQEEFPVSRYEGPWLLRSASELRQHAFRQDVKKERIVLAADDERVCTIGAARA